MEREPKNIEEALKIVTRLEAFDKAGIASQSDQNEDCSEQTHRQFRTIVSDGDNNKCTISQLASQIMML